MADHPGADSELDRLFASAASLRPAEEVLTVAEGLEVCSENAIAAILAGPDMPGRLPSRGAIEAVGYGVTPDSGLMAARIDLPLDSQVDIPSNVECYGPADRKLLVWHKRDNNLIDRMATDSGGRLWGMGEIDVPLERRDSRVMIAGAAVAKGIGRICGLQVPDIEGADGSFTTDMSAKTKRALELLRSGARGIVVHIEAPDLASHQRHPELKRELVLRAVREVVVPLNEYAAAHQLAVTVMADHVTSSLTGQHQRGPVTVYRS